MATRINWSEKIPEEVDENLQHHVDEMDGTAAGRLVHYWLEDTFKEEFSLDWEEDVQNGRYDAFDGTCIYEFKTKHPDVFDENPPYIKDVEQVADYLGSDDIEADFGIVVYINRGDLTEVKEYLYDGFQLHNLNG